MTTPAGDTLVRALAALVWTPREPLTVAQWAGTSRVLSSKTSDQAGYWDNDLTPFLIGVMNAFTEPGVRQITHVKGSQVGGTEVLNNIIGYILAHAPAPTIAAWQNETVANEMMRDRVKALMRACPAIMARVEGNLNSQSNLSVRMVDMVLSAVGAGSPSNLRTRPAKNAIGDEIEMWAPHALEEIRQRLKAFLDSKLVLNTTPGLADQGIDAEWKLSDQRTYHVPCPDCFGYFEPVWELIQWENGLAADPMEVERTAWMRCPHCSCAIEHRRKRWMVSRGVWVAAGEVVAVRLEEPWTDGAKPASNEPDAGHSTVTMSPVIHTDERGERRFERRILGNKRTDHAGFRTPSLISPFTSWGETARKFVEMKGRPTQEWTNGELGRPRLRHGEGLKIAQMRRLAVPLKDGGYAMGTVPARALWLCGAIDVQADGIWCQVDAWGPLAEDWWLIWCGFFPGVEGDHLPQLHDFLNRAYPRVNPGPGEPTHLRTLTTAIDSGDRTHEVYDAARRYALGVPGGRNLRATKGHGNPRDSRPWNEVVLEDHRVTLLHVNVNHWGDFVASACSPPDAPGNTVAGGLAASTPTEPAPPAAAAMPVVIGGATRRRLPADCPEEYFVHCASEHKVEVRSGRQVIKLWELRKDHVPNHLLDCSRYGAAMASRMGCTQFTESHRACLFRAGAVAVPEGSVSPVPPSAAVAPSPASASPRVAAAAPRPPSEPRPNPYTVRAVASMREARRRLAEQGAR